MQYFKAVLRLVSPLGTPLAADTLFGHLCWSMAYRNNETVLKEFLDEMQSEHPPILFSDPFPKGMLPVPVLPAVLPKDSSDNSDKVKKARKVTIFNESAFFRIRDCLSSTNLMREIITGLNNSNENNSVNENTEVTTLVPHNRIDRIGGGTISGGIFFLEETFVDTNIGTKYDLYIGSSYEVTKIETLLKETLEGGYGRDKGTGRGQIELIEIEPFELPPLQNANAGMLLGPCVPAKNDPVEGYWKIKAKAGKLGGHWAITENPFKKTIMMLQAGSIFKTEKPKPFYGRLISDVHAQLLEVRHYGLSLVLPVHLENEVAA
jgi:CRISPR-associated protein Csm4